MAYGAQQRNLAGHVVVPGGEEMPVELDDLVHLEKGGQDLVLGDETDPALDLDRLPVS